MGIQRLALFQCEMACGTSAVVDDLHLDIVYGRYSGLLYRFDT